MDAADVLDVRPETLRRWLAAGRFPHAKLDGGGRWRLPATDVLRAIEDGHARYPSSARQRLGYVVGTGRTPDDPFRRWLRRLASTVGRLP